jgi:hypothetical protein
MFQKAFLSEFWRDIVSISSAIITVLGFYYAIRQIWMTQSAAAAALKAANQAVSESRRSFERYTIANALRYFAEAKLYINDSSWEKASLRLSDLAEQTAQLAAMDPEWKNLTHELRQWSDTISRIPSQRIRFARKKWSLFAIKLQGKIDERHGPFENTDGGQIR